MVTQNPKQTKTLKRRIIEGHTHSHLIALSRSPQTEGEKLQKKDPCGAHHVPLVFLLVNS